MNSIKHALLHAVSLANNDNMASLINDAKQLGTRCEKKARIKSNEELYKASVEINKQKKIFYYNFIYSCGCDGGIVFADNIDEAVRIVDNNIEMRYGNNLKQYPYHNREIIVKELVPVEQFNTLFSYTE